MSAAASALAEWLDELPALVPSLDREPAVRGVLLTDSLTTGDTLLRAAPGAHPLLRGHAHLALAALHLVRAQDGDEPDRRVRQVQEHTAAAVGIAEQAAAPVLRVDLLPPASALLAGCLPLAPGPELEDRITQLAAAVGAALTEQAEEARRGMTRLAAAMALAEGASAVTRPEARSAVLSRAASMAREARVALVRAGELRRAAVAAQVADGFAARARG